MAPQEVELAGLIIALGLIRLVRSAFAQAQGPKQRTAPPAGQGREPPRKGQGREPPKDQGTELHPKGWLRIVEKNIYAFVE